MLNWANLVTVGRLLSAPFFLFFYLTPSPRNHTVALAIYLAAVLSDGFDGYIARRFDRVTDVGKFLDPLADKVIVVSALVSYVAAGLVPAWMVLAIVGRELIIMGFRAVAAARGIIIYATTLAKWKTASQMTAIGAILGHSVVRYWMGNLWSAAWDPPLTFLQDVIMWVAVILTLVTGVRYLWKNRQVLAGLFVK